MRATSRFARALVASTAGLALAAGCSVGPSSRPPLVTSGEPVTATAASTPLGRPVGPGGPGRTSEPVAWAPCPSGGEQTARGRAFVLDCGRVRVPKVYDRAGSGSLEIAVERARVAGLPASAPPLVAVLDGPGVNGAAAAGAVAGSLPAEVTARFAVVAMDMRGTGDSVAIGCVNRSNVGDILALGADPSTPAAGDLLATLARNLTFDCTDEAGPDLSDFATVPAADDLDTLRAALQVPTLSYLGRGPGATLGAVYAHRYPGRVGRMVLDGPLDPRQTPQERAVATATAAERALDAFAAACAGFAGGCPLGPDPRARITALVGSLGDAGRPVGTGGTGGTGGPGTLITGGSVLLGLLVGLPHPDRWPGWAAALGTASRSGPDLIPLSRLLRTSVGGTDAGSGVSAALVHACNDTAQRLVGPQLAAAAAKARPAAPLFGPFAVGLVGLCGGWPAPATPLGAVTTADAPPVVVVGSVDDPLSPFPGVRSVAAQVSSAVLVRWQSGTHGGYPASGCVTAAVDPYLLTGRPPTAGTLCPP